MENWRILFYFYLKSKNHLIDLNEFPLWGYQKAPSVRIGLLSVCRGSDFLVTRASVASARLGEASRDAGPAQTGWATYGCHDTAELSTL